MKLFEAAWIDNYKPKERIYDTETGKSIIKPITTTAEWFVPHSKGQYHSILDPEVKLQRKQGNAKDGREHWGFTDSIERHIRDHYWNEHQQDTYNKTPKIWYLDIETRVGKSFKHTENPNEQIKIRNNKSEYTLTVKKLQDSIYEKTPDNYEYFDEQQQEWLTLESSIYCERNTGFPKPNKAREQISLIQVFDNKENTMFVFGVKEWKHQSDYSISYNVKYIQCKDELDLINKYLTVFQKCNPLLIYAWNGNNFDFPYLFNRLKNLGIDTNKLSTSGKVQYTEKEMGYKTVYNLKAGANYYLDLLEIYKKFTFGEQASYSLDYTAEIVLNEKKVKHNEGYVGFDDFYTGNYHFPDESSEFHKNTEVYKKAIKYGENSQEVKDQAHSDFIYYGCQDTYLLKGIDEAKNFTALIFMIAEKMGITLLDTLGTVKPWSRFIANKALQNKEVVPKVHKVEDSSIKGGFVGNPQIGLHHWILSSDVNSMYPLLGMVGFNMSPETYIPIHKLPNDLREIIQRYFNDEDEDARLKLPEVIWNKISALLIKYNFSMGINGAIFNKSKLGIIPEMVQDIYKTRKISKKTMFKYEQKAVDIKNITTFGTLELTDIKDPLEYTEEELKQYTKASIDKIYNQAKQMQNMFNTNQLVQKVLINSLYGALANAYFPLYNINMARAITGNGRFFIKTMSTYIENTLQNLIPSNKQYILYNDTDSVVGNTVINTTLGNIKIEQLYNILDGKIEIRGNDNFIKHLNGKVLSNSYCTETEHQQMKPIKYIMKHKVKKRMFKITHKNKSVIVTEDHSIIIKRKNKYLDISAKDIKKGDNLISIVNTSIPVKTDEYIIEDLGVQEEWVYDIEVQDNHNFFGNDILVHNSGYFTVAPFVDKYIPNGSVQEKTDFCDKFYKTVVDKAVQKSIEDFGSKLNAYNIDVIGSEREIIADKGFWTAKKKYVMRVIDSEGVRYNPPKMKVMGLDLIRSGTPTFVKKKLKDSLNLILDGTEDDMIQWKDKIKEEYENQSLLDISKIQGVSNIDYTPGQKGIPIGARSVMVHNKYIQDNKLTNEIQPITAGDKVNQLYLKEPNIFNSNIIGWNSDRFVPILTKSKSIDYELNFEKFMLKPLELMTDALKWNIRKTTVSFDDDW